MILRLSFLMLFCLSFQVLGSSISIPLSPEDQSKRPAEDLIYQGNRIDSYQALELDQRGVNLAQLNPYESSLWKNEKLPLEILNPTSNQFRFEEYKRSPTEFFRAVVSHQGQRFVITASLDNHTNILRAGLLRKLGYDIALPRYLESASIRFNSREQKTAFLEKLGEETLTARSRWVATETQNNVLNLKDITIEPAELKNVNIHIPVMNRERQKQRRVFRGLLAIYTLTDFPQSINGIDEKIGRVFNGFLTFTHPYANQFRDVSLDDLKWMTSRLNQVMTSQDIHEIVQGAGYPYDIARLIEHKLKSRINSLSQHLSLPQRFNTNSQISLGNIQSGELTGNAYPNRVVEYFREDADSPYEFRELFRLFRTQATYNALSQVLDQAIDRIVPGVSVNDAVENIQDEIADFRINNGNVDGSLPLSVFTYPTAYVNASARRNVVFGQYQESVAPIQLVDSVQADANLGVYSMITGVNNRVTPSVSASVGFSRTYSHVRAMPDLETATSQEVERILVPRLMKQVGNILKTEFECSLTDTVTVQESELNGEPIVYIKFDTAVEGAIELARSRRQELIATGTPESIILLVPVEREEECLAEIEDLKTKSLDDFLKELADNETFIISDSINLIGMGNASLPLDPVLGQPLTLSVGAEALKGFVRAVFIRKKDGYIEVSLQRQKNFNRQLSLSLNYFIEVLRGTKKWFDGEQETLIYKIPTEGVDDSRKLITLKTLRELFVSNNTFYMDEHFDPITLNHDVRGTLTTLQMLWYKSESLYMDHNVEIDLPASDYPHLTEEQRKKTLFATSSMRRNGRNFFGFANSILSSLSRFLNLGSGNSDPGRTFQGTSKSRYYVTEGDISPDASANRITTKIDYIWRGWSAGASTLNDIFNWIEWLFDQTQVNYHIDRTQFRGIGPLKGFEIKSTFIIYPEFYQKFEREILDSSHYQALEKLRALFGEEKWNRYCSRRSRYVGGRRRIGTNRNCIPTPVKRITRLRRAGLPEDKKLRVKKFNYILVMLLEGFDRQKVLQYISDQNFFASTRVTGFLENSERGYVDYISNTFGRYNTEYGTGIFDQISSVLNITPYELRALNYTPGM
tara:strand:- start:4559 stop:7825 length:3267 start_codon:yes stop_codon:yes gene_type:complete